MVQITGEKKTVQWNEEPQQQKDIRTVICSITKMLRRKEIILYLGITPQSLSNTTYTF